MLLKQSCLLALLLLILFKTNAQEINKPLKGDLRVHDPVMIKQKDTYYIFHTGKGISIKTSKDRTTWANAGTVFSLTALPEWHKTDIPQQDGNLWAPDIHYRNEKYHLYYSVSA